ncbi:DUF1302 family protein [Pseudomonadota bacterium]
MGFRHAIWIAATGLFVTAGAPAFAQSLDDALGGFDEPAPTGNELDDALGGFDEEPAPTSEDVVIEEPSPWSLSGSVAFAAAYDYTQPAPTAGNPDYRGLSRARPKAAFKLKGNLPDQLPVPVRILAEATAAHELVYRVRGRGDYPNTLTASFERDINLGEVYVSAELADGFELTLGRQTIVWGTSENLRVVDVVNPLDQREMGMVDIENLRLPLTMARADYVQGPWVATAMVIPHIRFNKAAPALSPYDPMNGAAPQNDVPQDGIGNAELAASLRGNFSGWDISFHAANLFDDAGHKETVGATQRIRHSRVNMVGATADVALGNWLLKGEAARTSGLETLGVPGRDFTRSDVLAGVEFSGLSDASLSFEIVNRHLHGWSQALAAEGLKKNSQEYALRFSGDYLHDRLNVTALTTRVSPLTQGGGFSRISVEYDLQDALSITGGVVIYHDGSRTPFNAIADNDRIFFEIKQSF